VLRRLGLTAPAAGDRAGSRLWWCATGLLSLLPVHAAGRPGAPGVLDLVVSSVTPTLRALAHARRPAAAPRPGPGRDIVVVATPDLTGQVPLPAAAAERAMLAELFPGRVDTLEGDLATREAVLTAMITHRRIHLACHATADLRNPSRSMLVLADHERAPLTAADISALRLSDAELAFLSACDTARTAPALSDEAVHLASVLHIAGYRQVVATLWPISDRPAMRLSRAVYGRLATHDEESLAHALHAAVHAQRHRYPRHPFVWAGHVHLGG
jgi:CHAT domain-containing protein